MTENWAEVYSPSTPEELIHSNLMRTEGYQVPICSSAPFTTQYEETQIPLTHCVFSSRRQARAGRQRLRLENALPESQPAYLWGFCAEVFTLFSELHWELEGVFRAEHNSMFLLALNCFWSPKCCTYIVWSPQLAGPSLCCRRILTPRRLRPHFLFSFRLCVCGNGSTVCGLEVRGKALISLFPPSLVNWDKHTFHTTQTSLVQHYAYTCSL